MVDRYVDRDSYTYEGASVLINKLGVRNQKQLDAIESRLVVAQMLGPAPEGDFGYEHFRQLHHHLFHPLYTWAGEERNVPLSKGGNPFATPAFIHQTCADLFSRLVEELPFESKETLVARMAHYILELNAIHPFRDGNGRTMRYYLMLLCEEHGYIIHPLQLGKRWLDACVQGFKGDEQPMVNLLSDSINRMPLLNVEDGNST